MEDPLRILTQEFDDRRATTPGERRASRWLIDAVRRSTLQAWVEPFGSFRSARPAWALILGLSLLGGLLIGAMPWAAFGLTLLAALSFAAQALGWLELGWLFPVGESQNVVGVIPAHDEIRQRVVVVAHYDTGAQVWPRPAFVGVAIPVMCLPPVAVMSAVMPGALWEGLALLPLIGVGVGIATLLREGRESGNAAGVAAALAVGQGAPLKHTEVWTLFTGSRAPGLVGIQAFLLRHGRLLDDGHFIVLQQGNGGGATLWQRRGEAAVIAQQGHRVAGLLTVDPGDIRRAVDRVWAIADEIDRAAGQADEAAETE